MAKSKANHHDGGKLVGAKLKTNGKHALHKKGPHSVSLDVKNGKIAGMRVKHDAKGELPVRKYKTKKKMAQADNAFSTPLSFWCRTRTWEPRTSATATTMTTVTNTSTGFRTT